MLGAQNSNIDSSHGVQKSLQTLVRPLLLLHSAHWSYEKQEISSVPTEFTGEIDGSRPYRDASDVS